MITDTTIILAYNKIKQYFGYDSLQYSAKNMREKWKIELLSEGEFIGLKDYEINEYLKYIIKSNYVMDWCLGIPLKRNTDFSIFMEKDNPEVKIVSKRRINIDFSIIDIPSSIMEKWFDSNWDNFLEIINNIWNKDLLKTYIKDIDKIIKKYSPEQIWWSGNIMSRIDYLIKS